MIVCELLKHKQAPRCPKSTRLLAKLCERPNRAIWYINTSVIGLEDVRPRQSRALGTESHILLAKAKARSSWKSSLCSRRGVYEQAKMLFPSSSRATQLPTWTVAPVFIHTVQIQPFSKFLLPGQTDPTWLILKACYRWVPLHGSVSPRPPPCLAQDLLSLHGAAAPSPMDPLRFLFPPPLSSLSLISLLALPWEEDKLRHAAELKLQFMVP